MPRHGEVDAVRRIEVLRSKALLVCVVGFLALACGRSKEPAPEGQQPAPTGGAPAGDASQHLPWEVPTGFERVPVPPDNPLTLAKVQLGRKLYFDTRLSGDGKLSCYSCHVCEHGLTDGRPTAIGAFGKAINRSAPTMWNVGYHDSLYWDGRSPSLEKQALAAWKGGNMGANPDSIVAALHADPEYSRDFEAVFGGPITADAVARALATYMRTILCVDTPFDRVQRGDSTAMSAAAQRGWQVFTGKGSCGSCHSGTLFTDLTFHNVGIGTDKPNPDPGRFKVTQNPKDMSAFKTPTLRDVARSAPYFHDGSVATLDEAVRIMSSGGIANPNRDALLEDHKLTDAERADLVEFLKALECPCDPQALSLAPPPR
jgi:cytochrome c peroxidase